MEKVLLHREISEALRTGRFEDGLAILVNARRITAERGQARRNGSTGQRGIHWKPGDPIPPAARTAEQHRAWIYEQVETAMLTGTLSESLYDACSLALFDYLQGA